MSQADLQPGFDFQQAGRDVLNIEREGLAQLDQYINADFSQALREDLLLHGQSRRDGHGQVGPYR